MKRLIAGITTFAALGLLASDVSAAPLQCKDLRKGDVEACKKRVKKECTSKKYWDRRNCEHEIVAESDPCYQPAYTKACEKATGIYMQLCSKSGASSAAVDPRARFRRGRGRRAARSEFDFRNKGHVAAYVKAVKSADSKLAKYRRFHEEWGACYGTPDMNCALTKSSYQKCENTPAALRDALVGSIDHIVERDWVKKSENLLAELEKAKYIDELKHASVFQLAREDKTRAEQLLDVMNKLPKSHRHREGDLERVVARADAAIAGGKKLERALVANRRCPKGKKLTGKFRKLILARTNKKEVKYVRKTGEKHTSRDGLISRQTIPVVVCAAAVVDGKKVCRKTPMGLYREKPPGGSWTSWAASVGVGREINCKKMK